MTVIIWLLAGAALGWATHSFLKWNEASIACLVIGDQIGKRWGE